MTKASESARNCWEATPKGQPSSNGWGRELVQKDCSFLAPVWRAAWGMFLTLFQKVPSSTEPVAHPPLGVQFTHFPPFPGSLPHPLPVHPGISSPAKDLHPYLCLRGCSERTQTRPHVRATHTVPGARDSEQSTPWRGAQSHRITVPTIEESGRSAPSETWHSLWQWILVL